MAMRRPDIGCMRTVGNVNSNWPRCDGQVWPHSIQVGIAVVGVLAPEDGGGVAVEFGEKVFDSG
jgi:hypothetical protein